MKYLETGGAFCVAACFGFCSTKHLRAFSLSLHNECIKKAKPEMILPPVPADTHGPCSRGAAALNKATTAPVQWGWSSAGGSSHQGASLPRSLLREILVHHPENFLEQRLQSSSFPSSFLAKFLHGAFLPALPTWARFSQHTDTSLHLLQAGPPPPFWGRLDSILTSPSLPRSFEAAKFILWCAEAPLPAPYHCQG